MLQQLHRPRRKVVPSGTSGNFPEVLPPPSGISPAPSSQSIKYPLPLSFLFSLLTKVSLVTYLLEAPLRTGAASLSHPFASSFILHPPSSVLHPPSFPFGGS